MDVDTGFMVYNSLNYPNLLALFEELGIEGIDTTMGFSVSMDDGKFEWCGETLGGLFATSSNLINFRFYQMFRDIFRFNKQGIITLQLPENHPTRFLTTRQFLKEHQLSDAFAKYYLIPMTAAIWSASSDDILNFPIITLLAFLNNHLLLQTTGHLNWKTPKNRSQEYVNKIGKELGEKVVLNKTVKSVKRIVNSATNQIYFDVVDSKDQINTFDIVVFACHPDQALSILGTSASMDEKVALSQFYYSENNTYVHSDVSLMPKSKSAWTSWNYIGQSQVKDDRKPVFVTYWLNRLQHLNSSKDVFVSLNPLTKPAADKTHQVIKYRHPQYTTHSVNAQRLVAKLQGKNGTYFCG